MANKEKVSARYMEDAETGRIELVAGDKLADTKLIEPRYTRGNGQPFNVEGEEAARDATAEVAASNAEFDAKRADAARKKAEDAAALQQEGQTLDQLGVQKVQIVEAPAKAEAKPAKSRR